LALIVIEYQGGLVEIPYNEEDFDQEDSPNTHTLPADNNPD